MPLHQLVVMRLLQTLFDHARSAKGQVFTAPFDIVFTDHDVVQPDLLFFCAESAARFRLREHVRFPPDLAIEVLSPSTAHIDRGSERDLMARHGVPEYWIVDPDARMIEAFRLADGRYGAPVVTRRGRHESTILPGLRLDLGALFEGLD